MIKHYIKGDESRGASVINTLIELGGMNEHNYNGKYNNLYYYIGKEGYIECCNMYSDTAWWLTETCEEIKLSEHVHEFKPFDKVLVRDDSDDIWYADFFSNINTEDDDVETKFQYVCISGKWKQCIPYEGNEDKVGKVTD